ncbi:MAG: methylation-associated defense system AAA family ATPase MAD3 [Acidobacteriota bacterium]
MFTRIQALRFRSLKFVEQPLSAFCALVGPNGSGKTTFLDVIALLGDLTRNRGDVIETLQARSTTFEKLLWMGKGRSFQIAVEAEIPATVKQALAPNREQYDLIRYEVEIGLEPGTNEMGIDQETLWTMEKPLQSYSQRTFFPAPPKQEPSELSKPKEKKKVSLKKTPGGNDNYYTEGKPSYNPSFRLGRRKSALGNLPADSESFPATTWFRDLLERGVQSFVLNSQVIRQPSPPGLGRRFQTDGSNLPWVVAQLRNDTTRFGKWLDHVRTALEDIRDIQTVERPEDKHRYLVIEYANGATVPSWLVSDGTLRLLALTIPAYLPDLEEGTFLIEEPENGIHPRAIETVLQSLSSMYRSQVLVATHSPVALNMLEPDKVLCFAKDVEGATDIVFGNRHPALRDWKKGEPDLGVLFASGILS